MEYLLSAGVGAFIGALVAFVILRIAKKEHAAELDIEMQRTRGVEHQLSQIKKDFDAANAKHIEITSKIRTERDASFEAGRLSNEKVFKLETDLESYKSAESSLQETIKTQGDRILELQSTNAELITKNNKLEAALLEQAKSTKEVSGVPAEEEGGVWPEPVVYEGNPFAEVNNGKMSAYADSKFQEEDLGKYEKLAEYDHTKPEQFEASVSPETSYLDSPQKPKSKPRARNRSRAKKSK